MVDYAKWDKLAASLSDDEDGGVKPNVIQFDSAKSIDIGPAGAAICSSSSQSLQSSKNEAVQKEGGIPNYTRNGGVTAGGCFWCQDRYEVVLRKVLPEKNKASDMLICFDHAENRLRIINKSNNVVIIDEVLRYKVETNEELGESQLDWELKDEGKLLEVTFRKKSPFPTATLWWRNVFINDPEIDVTTIEGRSKGSIEMADAWTEAQRMFKEKIASHQKISVDIDDNDGVKDSGGT
jgi:hypothetical protein